MWKYKKAIKRGNEVTVTIVDDTDPENPDEKELTWTYDSDMKLTPKQFAQMVKREVKNHLNFLNATTIEEDVTAEYDPESP